MNSRIIEAIQNDKLVFFIGSGFSLKLGYPNWNGMVRDILNVLTKDYPDLHPFLKIMEQDNPLMSTIDILDILKNHDDRIYKILDKNFSVVEEKIKQNPDILETHRKISEISSKIITTNYDKSIEIANPHIKTFTYSNNFRTTYLNESDDYIFKLHGCIEDPTSCILYKKDYENLYSDVSEYKGAIEEVRKIIADKTIVFLGFSLTDPYVRYQFEYIRTIYKNLKGKHFLITTDKSVDYEGIEILPVEDWNNGLDNLLNELIEEKKKLKSVEHKVINPPNYKINETESLTVKIAILIGFPIDKNYVNYQFNKIKRPFSNWNVIVDYYYLTISNLNNLDGYQLIMLFTNTTHNRLIIEDEYFLSQRIELETLVSEIFDDSVGCLFVFTDKKSEFSGNNIELPIVIKEFDNSYNNFIYKVFKDREFLKLNNSIQLINEKNINISNINKGKYKVRESKTHLPPEIDSKELINFIGRQTDIENICRKILDLDGQLLTIKGSGGIGKTTLIKKTAKLISDRGYFRDGIHFIDCEHIRDFNTFQFKISRCYDLDSALNLKDYMIQNDLKVDKLIIIDNLESLLYLEETQEIKDLLSFLCDYAKVISTSREWVGFEFEDKYELRMLTTDECVDLFRKYYTDEINDRDIRILRNQIIENLLNNNPLAIKIVTSNIPKLKSMSDLKDDLEEDFFNTTKLEYNDIFNEGIDTNIERSKSLFHSINYSYSKLLPKEKLVFELLSLFPDGIHMSNFILVFKNESNRVTDRDIKSLENKSLISITGARIGLQSIIRRFASHKFKERSIEEKKAYYKRAYKFNSATLEFIENRINSEKQKMELFEDNVENYVHSFEYLDQLDSYDKEHLLYYVKTVINAAEINQGKKFIKPLIRLKDFFGEIKNSGLLIDLFVNNILYYSGEFTKGLSRINKLISLEESLKLVESDELVEEFILLTALSIYRYGNELEIINYTTVNKKNYAIQLYDLLYCVGAFKLLLDERLLDSIDNDIGFFMLDFYYNSGKLDIDTINKALEETYKKGHLQIMQLTYIKAKMGEITKDEVIKLVVVNPYSFGLKNLMFAFLETNYEKAVEYYERAIKNLKHIKYYYVEAVYYYVKFLKANHSRDYDDWVIKGRELAAKYHYRFLLHRFECLINGVDKAYVEDEYEIHLDFDVAEYMSLQDKLTHSRPFKMV